MSTVTGSNVRRRAATDLKGLWAPASIFATVVASALLGGSTAAGRTKPPFGSCTPELQVGIDVGSKVFTAFTTPALPAGDDIFVIATGLVGKLPRDPEGFGLLAVDHSGVIGFIKQNPIVYALHDSPGTPTVDIYAGTLSATSKPIVTGLAFGSLSAPIQVPPAGYSLSFFASGAAPTGTPAATATTPSVAAAEEYLALATGFLAADLPKGNKNDLQLAAFQEGFTLDDAANDYLCVIHGSPDAPAVDIGVVWSGSTIATPPLVSDLSFPNATAATGLKVATVNARARVH
jgi:hypothetical protein